MVGYRFGRIAIEGMGTRYDMIGYDGDGWTGTTLALAGKYTFPLADQLGAFLRGGIQRTDLSRDGYDDSRDFDGTGFLVGGGFEYQLPLAVASVSVFVDYTIQRTSLSSPTEDYDFSLTSRMWTLGATLSF